MTTRRPSRPDSPNAPGDALDVAARAYQLVCAADELPEDERLAWLRERSRGDEALRREICWLVTTLDGPDDAFLEDSASLRLFPGAGRRAEK